MVRVTDQTTYVRGLTLDPNAHNPRLVGYVASGGHTGPDRGLMRYASGRRARRERDRRMFGETSALARDSLMITHWPGHASVYIGIETLGYVAGPPEWAREIARQIIAEADRAEAETG